MCSNGGMLPQSLALAGRVPGPGPGLLDRASEKTVLARFVVSEYGSDARNAEKVVPRVRLSLSALAMTALEVSRDPRDLGGIPLRHRRFCWLGLMIPLGVLLAPPLLWILIVLVAPTNWARSHVIAKLERSSRRSVQLDDLHVCLDGGIELSGLKIGAPRSVGDPWLEAKRIQIDVESRGNCSGASSSRRTSRLTRPLCEFSVATMVLSSLLTWSFSMATARRRRAMGRTAAASAS